MKLLVIIVTYNAMNWINKCIDSVVKTSEEVACDIFIVDNGSSDGTQSYIKEHFPFVIFYQNEKNLGFGRSNNIGLQYFVKNGYDYAYLLNQDAWVLPGSIMTLINYHIEHSEYGILSPIQMQSNMNMLDDSFAISLNIAAKKDYSLMNDLFFGRTKGRIYSVPDVMAAHWLISRNCVLKVGGFSPTFPHYGEDNNYCHRVYYHGYKVGVVPDSRVVHARELRPFSKAKSIKQNYLAICSELSDINKSANLFSISIWIIIIRSMTHLRTIAPLKNWFKALMNIFLIRRNARLSKQEFAFLKK